MAEKKQGDHRSGFMSQEEMHECDEFLGKLEMNRGEMADYYNDWDKIQEAYAMNQELEDNAPNSRVNIVCANIEGQIDGIIAQNIDVTCIGEGPSDKGFARWGEIGLDWTLRKNRIKRTLDRFIRRFKLFGHSWIKLGWDADAVKKFGLVELTCPPPQQMFVDQKITDPLHIQDADYIAEVMLRSRRWAEKEYGEIAEAIHFGTSDRSPIFAKEMTTDDEDAFWLVQRWFFSDGKLRMQEMSDDGVLLRDSFKKWDGKKFAKKENPKPYYRYNKYPYFLLACYYEEGKLLGFGDGRLLRPLQDMLNDLYDQIRRAAKPNRDLFDPNSEVDLDSIDEDDGPIPCMNPNQNHKTVQRGNVNPALFQLVENIHREVQRVIRFSELMMGQQGMSDTATEAAIQQQQGASSLDRTKQMLEEMLVDLCVYSLDLMMEKYGAAKFFRISEDEDKFEWIDFRKLNSVPAMVPADDAYIQQFSASHPEEPKPEWMALLDEQGKEVTKSVDLDIKISIGAGLPTNKAFLYEMFEKLGSMVATGKDGVPKNVLTREEIRALAEDFLGLPLDDEELNAIPLQMPIPPQGSMPGAMPGANVGGLTPQGNPAMSALPGVTA